MKQNKIFMKISSGVVIAVFFIGAAIDFRDTASAASQEHQKEIKEVRQKIKKDSNNTELWMQLGQYYGWDEEVAQAVSAYEEVLKIDPDHLEARKKLVDFYSWNDMPEKSVREAEAVLQKEPDNLDIKFKLGSRYAAVGETQKARETYESILKADPSHEKARKALEALNRPKPVESKKHTQEIADTRARLEKEPRNTALWMELGQYYGWDGEVASAISAYEEVLKIDPDHLEARKKLVDFYSWNDMPERSAREAEEVLKAEPDNMDILAKLGSRYAALGRREDAERIFNDILRGDPNNLQARKGLAALSEFKSDRREAIASYLDILPSITTQKERNEVYERVADNYYYERSYARAREYAQEVLRVDPEDKGAQRILQKIKDFLKSRVFTEYENQKYKGDSHRQWIRAGYSKPTEDGSTYTGIYQRYIRTAIEEDRYHYDSMTFEWAKSFGDGLTTRLGGEGKFYGEEGKARFDYYFGAQKDFAPGSRGDFLYEKRTEDSDRDRLEQRVDRHSLGAAFYQDINPQLTLYMGGEGRYFTKGNAYAENSSIVAFISPIVHVMKNPIVDLAYSYYRIFSHRKDRNDIERFEYFAPRKFENHSLSVYLEADVTKDLKFVASEAVGWVDEPDLDETYMQNTISGELIWQINEDRRISVRYLRAWNIHNGSATSDKSEEWNVQCSIRF